jgi:hypothetical protein
MLAPSIDSQGFQLLASGSLMQFINNTRMIRLQMTFQVMSVMDVPCRMHWIDGDIKVEI